MHDTQSHTIGPCVLLLSSCRGSSPDVVLPLERCGARVTEQLLDKRIESFASNSCPDLILIKQSEHDQGNWQQLADGLRRAHPSVPVILVTPRGSEELAIAALRLGVRDYLRLPMSPDALSAALERCLPGKAAKIKSPDAGIDSETDVMVGSSEILSRVKTYMTRVAASDCTVLVTGETGTGKELAAEFIHHQSARRNKPFVCLNCAAIPDSLLESELFGHTRGAFTGADSVSDGLLASAEGGTVLLDEIGDMSLSAQAKILRVLEKKVVSRVGGTQQRRINVRFVAATNQDLESMAIRGGFRRDLYYRLNVARVELPPLRDRREDIPLLVDYYRQRLGGSRETDFSEECLRTISHYDWPGNIRELRNVLETCFLNCAGGEVHAEHLPQRLREVMQTERTIAPDERDRLFEVLCSTQWNKSRAAETLRWSRMTLYRKMAKYRISHVSPVRGSLDFQL
jgi:DNA-binding NtrC family response regulator